MSNAPQEQNELRRELSEIEHQVAEDRARLASDKRREAEIEAEIEGEKLHTIVVNGRNKEVLAREVTFNELVHLAFDPAPTGENVAFTITYRRGPAHKPEGTVVEGEVVKIKDEEIFNVTPTDKS